MIKYAVFDFDGTIADTFPLLENIGKDIADRYSLVIDSKKARDIGFKKALLQSKFPMWRLPKIILEVKKKIAESTAGDVKPVKGIKPVLKLLSQNYKLGILSSNSKENIEKFLKRNNLDSIFLFIHSDISLFGKHTAIKRLCKKRGIKPDELIYIGDEDRDIEAARKIGISNIGVTWGFNNKPALKKAGPKYLVSKPKEILKILQVKSRS